MTVEQIERLAERQTDALDRAYLSSDMSEKEYKSRLDAIDRQYTNLMLQTERERIVS